MGRFQTDDGRNFASKKSCMRALRRAFPEWPLQRHALLLLSPAPPSFNVGKQMWRGNLRNFFRSNAPPWQPGRRTRMSTLKFGGRGPLPDIVHACQRMMCVLLAKFLPSPVGLSGGRLKVLGEFPTRLTQTGPKPSKTLHTPHSKWAHTLLKL